MVRIINKMTTIKAPPKQITAKIAQTAGPAFNIISQFSKALIIAMNGCS